MSETTKARKAPLVTAIVAIALAALIIPNWGDLAAFVPMPAGAYAKFLASQLFVEGRTMEQATNWARLPLPVGKVEVDSAAKTVTVRAYFVTAKARWVDEKRGVILE